jgi:hypothetical protein
MTTQTSINIVAMIAAATSRPLSFAAIVGTEYRRRVPAYIPFVK